MISLLGDDQASTDGAFGNSLKLTDGQIKLLQKTDYTTNFYIRADFQQKNAVTGELENEFLTYYTSIIPAKAATYADGEHALINYLKDNSRDDTAIIREDKLQPGKVSFTVTKAGKITDVYLTSTSGYPSVDAVLIELINDIPGKWDPATNSKGQKVDQEFVFFFGLQGC
jgi:hypothetical protein